MGWGTDGVHGSAVLAAYMEMGYKRLHSGGPCPFKHCVVAYWRCTWRRGTGSVHGVSPCPLKHCVVGYCR